MDINVATHRINVAKAVESDFASGKPQNPRQYPVPVRKPGRQFRRVNLPCGPAPDKNRVFRESAADLSADDMCAEGRAITTRRLPRAIAGAGDRIAPNKVTLIII